MGSLSPKLVRDNLINPVLVALDPMVPYSVQRMELLLGTAAAESHLGEALVQHGGGPALGLWQMEPATERDLHENFLKFKPELNQVVRGYMRNFPGEMAWNHSYACSMAAVHYFRVPVKLPPAGATQLQAEYWKRWYNTYLGKGTPEHYLECWREYVEGKL